MPISDLAQRIQQEMQQAQSQKFACDPVSELHNFKYYQGRQEAYQNCLELIKKLEAEQ